MAKQRDITMNGFLYINSCFHFVQFVAGFRKVLNSALNSATFRRTTVESNRQARMLEPNFAL